MKFDGSAPSLRRHGRCSTQLRTTSEHNPVFSSATFISSPNSTLVVFGASVAISLALVSTAVATLALGPLLPSEAADGGPRPGPQTQAAQALCDNIFDASGSLCAAIPEPEPDPRIRTELPWCESAPRLTGVLQDHDDPHASIALFDGIGARTTGADLGGATVVAIQGDEVWLVTTSEHCKLGLFDTTTGSTIPHAAPPEPLPELSRSGDTTYIDESLIRSIVSDPARLDGARIVQRSDGFRLYGVQRGSLLARAGLQNGDVLRTVEGLEIDSPDDLLEAYARHAEARVLTVGVERRGQDVTLRFVRR